MAYVFLMFIILILFYFFIQERENQSLIAKIASLQEEVMIIAQFTVKRPYCTHTSSTQQFLALLRSIMSQVCSWKDVSSCSNSPLMVPQNFKVTMETDELQRRITELCDINADLQVPLL